MKKLIFTLAFMLIGSVAFASNGQVETIEDNFVIENVTTFNQISLDNEVFCMFEFSWNTAEHGTGSLWIDCGNTDDGPFDWNAFLNTILANFF